MWVHYDSEEAAVDNLIENKWRKLRNGRWVSDDGTCRASIHPAGGGKSVIFYSEIRA